jgi:hypothetical protein
VNRYYLGINHQKQFRDSEINFICLDGVGFRNFVLLILVGNTIRHLMVVILSCFAQGGI